jgi:hypothetical protein
VSAGGYGFNALAGGLVYFGFLIGAWLGAAFAHPVIDRVNIYFIRKHDGIVKPEYRLHCLWPTIPLLSGALGLFGACLQFNLHWMGIVMANLIYQGAVVYATAATTTYVVENYLDAAGSASLAMNFWRLIGGVVVPFYQEQWVDSVGAAWSYGTEGLLNLGMFSFILLLMWKGPQIKSYSFKYA